MERKILKTIKGGSPSITVYLNQVWQSRNLIATFAIRDLKVQYAQTYLGVLWSLIQPLTGLLIFTFFFNRILPLEMSAPYPVFVLTGIMGWFYFTSLVGHGGTVLLTNQLLIKKIHFPRLILLLSKAFVGLIEFSISFCLLVLLMLFTGCDFTSRILLLPFAILCNILAGLSIAIWLSALTVRFRDLHHIIPYLIGFGIWLTPVFYPTTIVPNNLNWIYYLHPAANVIALYRWIFVGLPVDFSQLACSMVLASIIAISGLLYFIRNEKFIADYL